jgi:hypothetical protein
MSEYTETFFYSIAEDVRTVTNNVEREKIANGIGKKLQARNKKFNWDKWFDACNVKRPKGLASHVPPILHQSGQAFDGEDTCGRVIHRAGQSFREAGYNNFC